MPPYPIDFSKTLMYKIVCKDLNVKDVYNGRTTNWKQRIRDHKSCVNNKNKDSYKWKLYKTIREHGGWENWSMIEIEKYNCKDSNEASARERFWYEQLQSNLNTDIPNRSEKEYKQDHIESYKQRADINNHKMYTCECGTTIRLYEVSRHKLTKKHTRFFEPEIHHLLNNNNTINSKTQIVCKCGGRYTHINKIQHFKTKKHLEYLSENKIKI